jgi:hypothetical protein
VKIFQDPAVVKENDGLNLLGGFSASAACRNFSGEKLSNSEIFSPFRRADLPHPLRCGPFAVPLTAPDVTAAATLV